MKVMRVLQGVLRRSAASIVRLACWIALVGLASLCVSVLFPSALPVIFAMSAGHVLGFAAFVCYLLAVVIDARGAAASPSAPEGESPPARDPD